MTSPSAPFPFGAIASVVGTAVAVRGDDIDTDRIIPARFLKCVTFDGLGEQAFADDRAELNGAHPFDHPEHQGATVLVVNRNFGCGSSREHAPQSLMRWGIRAVIGESFAEIFYGNCLALGIPCLSVSHADALALQAAIQADPAASVVVELETLRVSLNAAADSAAVGSAGASWPLTLADGPRRMLLSGQWDATSQLLAHDGQLRATAVRLPYLTAFSAV
ncbi:3-isopropylmalate dehydratase small subunit 2 [Synechococcus sp. CS-1328]|uniref:3-isopropylmalate dehydratase small subunit n=1 Tax=Synechococcus sp. CS-1328 TaxID=2847976 RepID=UPI00223B5028|nr:3-isopropylmalate dehydratase small subunit [Synechococcus sp. CS-1328]MCT0224561.1 3-isopropylmalate dehydratase small subunit [Synechococcus sp. CS-1328]